MTQENRLYEDTREMAGSVEQVWDILANTDRLNRSIGLPRVEYGPPQQGPEGIFRPAAALYAGLIPMRWKEFPFEWVRHQRYTVLRLFEAGPIVRFRAGIDLVPAGAKARTRVFAEIQPRHWMGARVAPVIARRGIRDTFTYCERRLLEDGGAQPAAPAPTRTAADRGLLERRVEALAAGGANALLLERLGRWLDEAGDEDVLRMKPYALADRWKADREETLRLFLQATRAGLLDLAWVLICPNCRVPKDESRSLRTVKSRFHCETCGVDYESDFDRAVELRFSVHPAVRPAADQIFCIGGPMNTPHILAQQRLEPGAERDVALSLGGEPGRVRALGLPKPVVLDPAPDGADRVAITLGDGGIESAATRVLHGPVVLRLRNSGRNPAVAVVERTRLDPSAATAAEVTALQEFRDLFGSEVLAPGQELGVRSVTVMFTDLKDSTLLYETVGDAPAYGRVRRHFDYLIGLVQKHHGAVIKTIGDAVMAVFHRPEEALRAALEMQGGLGAFNRAHSADRPLVIKIGLHEGPSIAMTANERLDYFGRTVNTASRIQGESHGGDVVATQSFFARPEVQAALNGFPFTPEPFTAALRGIEGAIPLIRLRLSGA